MFFKVFYNSEKIFGENKVVLWGLFGNALRACSLRERSLIID